MAQSPGSTATDLLDLTRRMDALIERETELLRGAGPAEIAPLQDEKNELGERYAAALDTLRTEPAARASLSDAARGALRAATAALRDRLAANARAIEAARVVNERLIRAIGEAVVAQRAPGAGYSAAGIRAGADPRRPVASAALALDRHI